MVALSLNNWSEISCASVNAYEAVTTLARRCVSSRKAAAGVLQKVNGRSSYAPCQLRSFVRQMAGLAPACLLDKLEVCNTIRLPQLFNSQPPRLGEQYKDSIFMHVYTYMCMNAKQVYCRLGLVHKRLAWIFCIVCSIKV